MPRLDLRSSGGDRVSAYRDRSGRYRKRTGLDVLDDIGGFALLAIIILALPYLIGLAQSFE